MFADCFSDQKLYVKRGNGNETASASKTGTVTQRDSEMENQQVLWQFFKYLLCLQFCVDFQN